MPESKMCPLGAGLFFCAVGAVYALKQYNKKKYSLKDVIFVLGGPGAGKGTQCSLLVEKFGFKHLSAGDLLRAERNSGSKLAELINKHIADGTIVPAEITIGLLKKAMEESPESTFLIDGFPRSDDNRDAWERIMTGVVNTKMLLFLNCPEEVMSARLMERGKTSGRIDDNAEAIMKRFRTYRDTTMPVIEYYRRLGKVREINSARSVEVIFEEICGLFR